MHINSCKASKPVFVFHCCLGEIVMINIDHSEAVLSHRLSCGQEIHFQLVGTQQNLSRSRKLLHSMGRRYSSIQLPSTWFAPAHSFGPLYVVWRYFQPRKYNIAFIFRIITNKLLLIIIILLELCVLGAVVYWKFFHKKWKTIVHMTGLLAFKVFEVSDITSVLHRF